MEEEEEAPDWALETQRTLGSIVTKPKLVAKRKILKKTIETITASTISDEEKKKSIKKYGGYYDENDNFIIE